MALGAVALFGFAVVTGRAGTSWRTMRAHPALTTAVGMGTAVDHGLYVVSVILVGALGLTPFPGAMA